MGLKNIKSLNTDNSNFNPVFKNEEILTVLYDLLENSKSWDLGLGYFHLSGFKQLAWPLSQFLINGGKIRVYSKEKS